MNEAALLLLVLLQLKHWYIDFVNQSMEEVHSKGIYGTGPGIMHSVKQGVGTVLAILAVTGGEYVIYAAAMGLLDFVLHYHIDWSKININKRWNYTIEDPKFWAWLGADQLAHQLTYILITYLVIS